MRTLLLVCGIAASSAPLLAQPASPPVVEYTIEVRLDPAAKTLKGHQRLVWRNPSDEPVGELQFHLYANAFESNQSTFMRESGGMHRANRAGRADDHYGWIRVRSMRHGGHDLLAGARYIQPDTPDPDDHTVLLVPLPSPVPPRGTIELAIDFEEKLPRAFARSGWVRDYFAVGQWFPKLGVYEPTGMRGRTRGGWNCHQFHADSEFYADFGTYDVSITLPSRFVVGATGRMVSRQTRGSETTHRYRQENVHDFAWIADPRFRTHVVQFDPSRDVPAAWVSWASRLLGRPREALLLHPFTITFLMQPDHEDQFERYRRVAIASFAWFGLRYGPYPYDTITIVDPPEDGRGTGGVEYPTLITAMTSRLENGWLAKDFHWADLVLIHEIAHQYFYGLLASNEFEESWLDEGFSSHAEQQLGDLLFGWRTLSLPVGTATSDLSRMRQTWLRARNVDPLLRNAWSFADHRSYVANSYSRSAVFLRQLEGDLGSATFARATRAYVERFAYRHPTTDDFLNTFEEVSGRSMKPYEDHIIRGTGAFNIFVGSATSALVSEKRGLHEIGGKMEAIAAKGPSGAKRYRTSVTIGREGPMPHGAMVRLTFEGGKVESLAFPPDARWKTWEMIRPVRLQKVEVDPELRNVWDTNLLDNSRALRRDARPAAKTALSLEWIMALLLQLVWGIA